MCNSPQRVLSNLYCKLSFDIFAFVGNENGEPVIAERQIRIMDKPLGQRNSDDGKERFVLR